MTMIVQQFVNGITQGGLYALLAISYALVYGVMSLVNFSTGSIYMLGAVSGWLLCNYFIESFFLSLVAGFAVGFVIAFVLRKNGVQIHPGCQPNRIADLHHWVFTDDQRDHGVGLR